MIMKDKLKVIYTLQEMQRLDKFYGIEDTRTLFLHFY